jgi:cytochrome c-type biogenesis protein CcmF
MDIVFKGEHLLPGQLGQFFVVLAFGAALFSLICYYFAAQEGAAKSDNSWLRLGRIGYWLNTIAILGMGVCLFYILYNTISSIIMPGRTPRAIIACLLHRIGFLERAGGWLPAVDLLAAVLGNILIWRAKSWESPVMTVLCL